METQDYSLIFDLDNGWVTVGGIRSVLKILSRENQDFNRACTVHCTIYYNAQCTLFCLF
jgi:hypothetical protein